MSENAPRTAVQAAPAAGPLVVSRANPRYFAVRARDGAEGRAVYLTGAHIWHNFHDGMGPGRDCPAEPERLDFDAYLAFLAEHGHNFIRLWRWEHCRSQAAGGDYHLCMAPQPWPRVGPGMAADGRPKFDLDRFDPAYFARLRERVIAAGERGIYVAVMLFDGFALHLSPAPDHVAGHPFAAANNVNGVGIASINDYQVLPLDPRVRALQEAYIREVVDTVHDLPNVLYEVANESVGGGRVDDAFAAMLGLPGVPDWGDSTAWQYRVIETVKAHERRLGYDPHPVGMTMPFPVADQRRVNDPLLAGPADWIAPGHDDAIFADGGHPGHGGLPESRWYDDPPAGDGTKVILSDTDHYAAGRGDALWAWRSFLRGHHPLLMDYGLIGGAGAPDLGAGTPEYAAFEAARYAMGDTRRFAERVDLVAMAPRGDLCSTGYVLANPGAEYLVLQPGDAAEPFTVTLKPGTYAAEWFGVQGRETVSAAPIAVGDGAAIGFSAPFPAPGGAVLHLKRVEG